MSLVDEQPDPANEPHTIRLFDMPPGLDPYNGEPVRVLLCVNGSPHRDGSLRRYGLTVPASFDNAHDAAAWTYGLDPATYAGLLRRT